MKKSELQEKLDRIGKQISELGLIGRCINVAKKLGNYRRNCDHFDYWYQYEDLNLHYEGVDAPGECVGISVVIDTVPHRILFSAKTDLGLDEPDRPKCRVRCGNMPFSVGLYFPGEWEDKLRELEKSIPEVEEELKKDKEISHYDYLMYY